MTGRVAAPLQATLPTLNGREGPAGHPYRALAFLPRCRALPGWFEHLALRARCRCLVVLASACCADQVLYRLPASSGYARAVKRAFRGRETLTRWGAVTSMDSGAARRWVRLALRLRLRLPGCCLRLLALAGVGGLPRCETFLLP